MRLHRFRQLRLHYSQPPNQLGLAYQIHIGHGVCAFLCHFIRFQGLYWSKIAMYSSRSVLMNPLESCLFQPSPPLRKILNILQISHKYCCEAIKNFARPLALRMTSSTSIRAHTGPSLPVEIVFRIGVKVFESSIYRSAWGLILEAFREHKMTARDLLNEGRHSGLDEILASALYEAMISGRERWDRDGLSSKARQALARGMLSCTEDWNAFVFRLASGNLEVPWRQPRRRSAFLPHPTPVEGPYIVIPSQCCRHARQQYNAELATISQIHAFFRVPSYDIIGRLSKIREELPDIRNNPHHHEQWRYPSHECEDCWGTVVAYAKETKALITSQLSLYFFEGQHRRSSETRYGGGLFGVVDSLDL
ncbi:uncharacterized protein EI90DRAFT_3092011 [Cantharellus anzutake]|uniref:uncharacterized protein n=1 Tax=Cantharellus anzutake TaxID=1750568 RepID=UPI001907690F|nr:uncharacterized protein EI90DRAFT_3092011 [Cantharellus anzutake]KAF8313342.1 hypothetical protein EI90DRAFT_3092011 [Cantharellus anzutake]